MDWPLWNDVGPLLILTAGVALVWWACLRWLLSSVDVLVEAFRPVLRQVARETARDLYTEIKKDLDALEANLQQSLDALGQQIDGKVPVRKADRDRSRESASGWSLARGSLLRRAWGRGSGKR